jgi:hypothetical protein
VAVGELIAGKVTTSGEADLAHRIVAQQIHILLISNCRRVSDENSNRDTARADNFLPDGGGS